MNPTKINLTTRMEFPGGPGLRQDAPPKKTANIRHLWGFFGGLYINLIYLFEDNPKYPTNYALTFMGIINIISHYKDAYYQLTSDSWFMFPLPQVRKIPSFRSSGSALVSALGATSAFEPLQPMARTRSQMLFWWFRELSADQKAANGEFPKDFFSLCEFFFLGEKILIPPKQNKL